MVIPAIIFLLMNAASLMAKDHGIDGYHLLPGAAKRVLHDQGWLTAPSAAAVGTSAFFTACALASSWYTGKKLREDDAARLIELKKVQLASEDNPLAKMLRMMKEGKQPDVQEPGEEQGMPVEQPKNQELLPAMSKRKRFLFEAASWASSAASLLLLVNTASLCKSKWTGNRVPSAVRRELNACIEGKRYLSSKKCEMKKIDPRYAGYWAYDYQKDHGLLNKKGKSTRPGLQYVVQDHLNQLEQKHDARVMGAVSKARDLRQSSKWAAAADTTGVSVLDHFTYSGKDLGED